MLSKSTTLDACAWDILWEFGLYFYYGARLGALFHLVQGARNSPAGERFVGAFAAVRARTLMTAGRFGAYGATAALVGCALRRLRQKEDVWSIVLTGFLAGPALAPMSSLKVKLGLAVGSSVYWSLSHLSHVAWAYNQA